MKNFKELEAQQIALFSPHKEKVIFDRVSGTMDVFRLLGAIVEIYVPVMASTVVNLTGGNGDMDFLSEEEAKDSGIRPKDSAPRGPGENGGETVR